MPVIIIDGPSFTEGQQSDFALVLRFANLGNNTVIWYGPLPGWQGGNAINLLSPQQQPVAGQVNHFMAESTTPLGSLPNPLEPLAGVISGMVDTALVSARLKPNPATPISLHWPGKTLVMPVNHLDSDAIAAFTSKVTDIYSSLTLQPVYSKDVITNENGVSELKDFAEPISFYAALPAGKPYSLLALSQQPATALATMYSGKTICWQQQGNGYRLLKPLYPNNRPCLRLALHLASLDINANPKTTGLSGQYSALAPYYNHYMRHVDYQEWAELILARFNRLRGRSPKLTLELACGTGSVSRLLVHRGLQVEASDLNPPMLEEAALQPWAPLLYRADMLDKLPSNRYDLVFCVFDSVNYLHKPELMGQLLQNVYQGLNNEGVFVFDVSTLHNCRHSFADMAYHESIPADEETGLPGIEVLHQACFIEADSIQQTDFTFLSRKPGLHLTSSEQHHQKIYPTATIIKLVKDSAFSKWGVFSVDTDRELTRIKPDSLDKRFDRLFFVLSK